MGSRRALLVDDESQLIGLVRRYLDLLDYECVAAGTAAAAGELLDRHPAGFALAIIDVTLPGISGTDLARRILQGCAHTRVILTSGYPVDLDAFEILAPGRVAFLQKPFTARMLQNKIGGR